MHEARDVCKQTKDGACPFKNYTLTAYAHDTCCRKCYRKDQNKPCLMGYVSIKAGKKQGSQKVPTWDPEDRSMKDSKTKLCCRIKWGILQQMDNESMLGPFMRPSGAKIVESKCYETGSSCGAHGDCNPVNGQCVCHSGWFDSAAGECTIQNPCLLAGACSGYSCTNHGNGTKTCNCPKTRFGDDCEKDLSDIILENAQTCPAARNQYGR